MAPPGKKSRYISFLLNSEIEAALDKVAAEDDRSRSWLIRKAIEEFLVRKGALKKSSR